MIYVCFHPHSERWRSDEGVFEICRLCSETRRITKQYWPPAHRVQRVEGDCLLTFDLAGRLFQRLRCDADEPVAVLHAERDPVRLRGGAARRGSPQARPAKQR